MAQVYLICGKICSGKTTYAHKLCRDHGAVLLSVDEIMLSMFGQHCGEMHDTYADRTKKYLLDKAAELIGNGISVVLDWGFWRKDDRDAVRDFFGSRNIPYRFECIRISDELWQKRIGMRNRSVLSGETEAYYVDENLAAKFETRFEMPDDDEIDNWILPESSDCPAAE